ncbi:MAG: Mannosylfructose-phosphate phosphatase [Alphaproteobacteria bacterium ADurb.Bin438]|nr:MAG: Mannosylfructose-phosphate phosphatase [Alphaproteobacteria bacterium ADurb.Bin438]
MKILHITDFDDTLCPRIVEGKPNKQQKHIDHYKNFIKKHPEIIVTYSSGRTVQSILERIETHKLPLPDFIIGSVGGEIYDYKKKEYLKSWEEYLSKSKNWDNAEIRKITKDLGIKEQAECEQHKYKISLFLYDTNDDELNKIKKTFDDKDIEINLVYSSKAYLDIIPLITNKGKSGVFLAKYLNIPLKNVAISGDSFNDLDMFFENFGIKIAPSNSEPELIEIVKNEDNFYLAKNEVAYGTVEGLEYFLKQKRK